MLHETAARASEVLVLDVEDLDLDTRRAGCAPWAATPDGSPGVAVRIVNKRLRRFANVSGSPTVVASTPAGWFRT